VTRRPLLVFLVSICLGVPALLLAGLGYFRIGSNSCQWYGDEYECWMLLGEPIYFFVISGILLFALAAMIFNLRKRDG